MDLSIVSSQCINNLRRFLVRGHRTAVADRCRGIYRFCGNARSVCHCDVGSAVYGYCTFFKRTRSFGGIKAVTAGSIALRHFDRQVSVHGHISALASHADGGTAATVNGQVRLFGSNRYAFPAPGINAIGRAVTAGLYIKSQIFPCSTDGDIIFRVHAVPIAKTSRMHRDGAVFRESVGAVVLQHVSVFINRIRISLPCNGVAEGRFRLFRRRRAVGIRALSIAVHELDIAGL